MIDNEFERYQSGDNMSLKIGDEEGILSYLDFTVRHISRAYKNCLKHLIQYF